MLAAWADLSAADPPEETSLHTNRLANQTSPYLLQHAHNPVNWYPWGVIADSILPKVESDASFTRIVSVWATAS